MKRRILFLFFLCAAAIRAQDGGMVDFTEGHIAIEVFPSGGLITGSVAYEFIVRGDTDSIGISSRGLDVSSVTLGKKQVVFEQSGNTLILKGPWEVGRYRGLTIHYSVRPKQAVYFPGWSDVSPSKDSTLVRGEGGRQVWTQGQGKYSSSWVPSFDAMNEKVRFSIDILFPEGYEVMANGKLIGVKEMDGKRLWQFRMKHRISSYLLAFAAGTYEKRELRTSSGVPIALYHYPEDSLKVAPTYEHTRKIMEFLEEEIGVGYPWQNYKQVPVRDFLYAGMENVTLTIFSDTYMTDTLGATDKSFVNVNAHEMAHHWFGNLVTEESGTHHWLQEGFATYYALLAERHLFGDDHYYWKLYDTAVKLMALSDQGNGESLLNKDAGSLTFYEKGAWALHILRERVGDKAFRRSVKELLDTHAFSNINTEDLLSILRRHTAADLDDFRRTWLEGEAFPKEEVLKSLGRNVFMKKYMDMEEDQSPAVVVYNDYIRVLKSDSYYPLKQQVLERAAQWPDGLRDSLWSYALAHGDVKTRQGVALAADTISRNLKPQFETLLDDASYTTVQEALIKLWLGFPEDRETYLEKTARLRGFEDRSLRILWLGLALFTPEYEKEATAYFEELTAYTAPGYPFEVRQQAMNMIYQIGGYTQRSLLNVLQGMQHPAWQFSRFCSNMIDTLSLQPETRTLIRSVLPQLDPDLKDLVNEQLEKAEAHENRIMIREE